MSYVFSIHLSDDEKKELDKLMGMWPTKSRNGVIRHIINTYLADRNAVTLQLHIEALQRKVSYLEDKIL